jgi:predicted nucleotidyltransferase
MLTRTERKALLMLAKDYTCYYNANSLSKKLGISHVGAQKILKRFYSERLTITKNIGKSIIHRINLDEDYAFQLLSFLLADEANNFRRWREEFRELSASDRIIILFGSVIKNYKEAKDIDLMIVHPLDERQEVNKVLAEKNEILPKKLHAIKLTKEDFQKNLKKKEIIFADVIKNSVVLYEQDKFVEVLKTVTGF